MDIPSLCCLHKQGAEQEAGQPLSGLWQMPGPRLGASVPLRTSERLGEVLISMGLKVSFLTTSRDGSALITLTYICETLLITTAAWDEKLREQNKKHDKVDNRVKDAKKSADVLASNEGRNSTPSAGCSSIPLSAGGTWRGVLFSASFHGKEMLADMPSWVNVMLL